jgi:hypothetical protein
VLFNCAQEFLVTAVNSGCVDNKKDMFRSSQNIPVLVIRRK